MIFKKSKPGDLVGYYIVLGVSSITWSVCRRGCNSCISIGFLELELLSNSSNSPRKRLNNLSGIVIIANDR